MRLIKKSQKYSTGFSQRGLVANYAMRWILSRLIGPYRALGILWSARKFDGTGAMRLGIADRLCEAGESVNDARSYITELPTQLVRLR
jgi:enoyl-CoA hydratase/carnithine racemase